MADLPRICSDEDTRLSITSYSPICHGCLERGQVQKMLL